jgi:hypothetical protein
VWEIENQYLPFTESFLKFDLAFHGLFEIICQLPPVFSRTNLLSISATKDDTSKVRDAMFIFGGLMDFLSQDLEKTKQHHFVLSDRGVECWDGRGIFFDYNEIHLQTRMTSV